MAKVSSLYPMEAKHFRPNPPSLHHVCEMDLLYRGFDEFMNSSIREPINSTTRYTTMDANELLKLSESHPIVLFDGKCNLCDSFVQFVMKRDKVGVFRFAPLQSEVGRMLLRQFDLDENAIDTVVLIENSTAHIKSTAALRTARRLGGLWSLAFPVIILPKFIRDNMYDFIAKNRYRWFGKKDACMIPTPEVRGRFLG